jgi:inner membrane transporter RhtA
MAATRQPGDMEDGAADLANGCARRRVPRALAVSMPVAAIATTLVEAPSVADRLTWQMVRTGLGLALLLPVVPFSLELLALRRLTTAAFGTL